jgi:hypothetical protein
MSEQADLLAFLCARIDEDERVAMAAARAANTDTWIDGAEGSVLGIGGDMHLRGAVNSIDDIGPHIARWDPARVLAEVEAKRRILEEHRLASYRASWDEDQDICGTCRYDNGLDVYPYPCPTVRLLALPYADHPDYRDEWGPTVRPY